jgi:glycosyltransferase involved in cell wall biosynthesis
MSNFTPWKILHLELSENIPSLAVKPNYQGLYVVFRWHGMPLGYQAILAAQLPMPVSQVANLAGQIITPAVADQLLLQKGQAGFTQPSSLLAKEKFLETPLKMVQKHWSKTVNQAVEETISIIICTRDRPEQLAHCLRSLQNLSQSPHEIIVVDNAPVTDKTRQLVGELPGVRYVLEPRAGLSLARNAGIRHSTGDIIAFTDDDVTVHADWLAGLHQGFQHPQVMAVTGLVIPAELETEAQVIFEMGHGCLSGHYTARTFDQEFFQATRYAGVPVWSIGAGANMAFRRHAFDLVGNFEERLGAGASGCSEDSELWYRVLAEGWLCQYEPTAVVYHSHRREMAGLRQQMYQYMRGHVVALLIQFARYKHWGNLRRLVWSLPKYYAGLLLFRLIGGFELKQPTYWAEV